MSTFDPNSAASGDGIFGLPFEESSARLVLVNAPFEATTSYLGGTSKAPKRILTASHQVDLFHPLFTDAWKQGIALSRLTKSLETKISSLNSSVLKAAKQSRKLKAGSSAHKKAVASVNKASASVNNLIEKEVGRLLDAGKIVGLVGGDHATPLGIISEVLRRHPSMGILHLDAHFDLRKAYEGFEFSHASIFYNVMTRLELKHLVQVGIRDYCDEEFIFAQSRPEIKFYTDQHLFSQKAHGQSWDRLSDEILSSLPKDVYLSFDIDGLDPLLCPGTGTPVPGGLSFNELTYLIQKLVASGRRIVGFDLVEVGPTEWDANVGARLLYQMCLATLSSQ